MNVIAQGFRNFFEPGQQREGWERLAGILQIDVDQARALPSDPQLSYRNYQIKKKDGRRRQISAPSGKLKQLQRRLAKNYLNALPVHYCSHAFSKYHSIKTHAATHRGQELVLTCDIKDFFSETSVARVSQFLREHQWQGEPVRALQKLTTYRGSLPQGAPTSPVLSNLVNQELDERLAEHATLHQARYSRYCDDLAFSWQHLETPDAFRVSVEGILESFGYQLQLEKGWRIQRRSDNPEMTGIAIHGYTLRPSRALRSKKKQLAKAAKHSPAERQRLEGLKAYWRFLRY